MQDTIGKPAAYAFDKIPALAEHIGDEKEASTEIELTHDQAQKWYLLRISPLRDHRDRLTGRIINLQDITAIREAARQIEEQNEKLRKTNEELAVAREAAEEANRLKSDFLANISHELRTPLGSIMGFVQLLLAGAGAEHPFSERQRHNLERIYANGQDLLNLINSLLDLAKIEAGRFELIEQPFKLRPWLDDIQSQAQGLAVRRNLEVRLDCDEALPDDLIGDAERIKQAVLNLISNAVKFTEKGHVQIVAARHDSDQWRLQVTDTGIGIEPEKLKVIFEPFRQIDGGVQRQFGGTGLGLSIVRNLVELMDGSVAVESEKGQGSTFTITLPLKPVPVAPGDK